MEKTDFYNLKIRLETLTVFRDLLKDQVFSALCSYLDSPSEGAYAEFVSLLYNINGGNLAEHIKDICENSENVFVRTAGSGHAVPDAIRQCAAEELNTLQAAADLTPIQLRQPLEWKGFLPEFSSGGINLSECFAYRVKNIGRCGYGIYAKNRMFYVDELCRIVPVNHPDAAELSNLIDYEEERQIIIDNTKALLEGKPAANILLTGDAGTGKSSTVKAVGNALFADGLRIIELRKDQLRAIPKILDTLAGNPLKFVIFIDDLSFLKDDDNFNALKAVLEGSVSAKSRNVVIYATSNRRHIIKEKFSDREGDDVHRNETMQELLSLSDRFGLRITFQRPNKETFLHIVHHLAEINGISVPDDKLEAKAERFALERGGRSARLARQFIDRLLSM